MNEPPSEFQLQPLSPDYSTSRPYGLVGHADPGMSHYLSSIGLRRAGADTLALLLRVPLVILPPNPSMLHVSWEKPPLTKTTETEMDIHDHPISSPTSQLIRNTIRKFRRLSKGSPACSPSGFRIVLISTRRITKTENHYSSWLGGLSVRGL